MLVSVIIPCYNVQYYIEDCILSVINQTYKNLEIICVDNNSTDDTWNVLQKLKKNYPQIILDKELRAGANYARNKGLSVAKGDWIQFLDADDLLEKIKIEHQIDLVKNNNTKNIAFIAGAWKKMNTKGEITLISKLSSKMHLAPFINKAGITSSNLWSSIALKKINGWNESLKSSQEADLMLRLVIANFSFLIDEMVLTTIRERAFGQISQRNPSEKWAQYIDVRLQFLSRLTNMEFGVYEKHKSVYYDFLMVSLLQLAKYDLNKANLIFKTKIQNKWETSNNYGFTNFKFFLMKLLGLKLYAKIFIK